MKRTIEQWTKCQPEAMAYRQSPAAIWCAFIDAKHDILELHAAQQAAFEAEQDALATMHALAAERAELLAELQNIANAKPESWEPEVRDQFMPWAQNRARAAIAKVQGLAAGGDPLQAVSEGTTSAQRILKEVQLAVVHLPSDDSEGGLA